MPLCIAFTVPSFVFRIVLSDLGKNQGLRYLRLTERTRRMSSYALEADSPH